MGTTLIDHLSMKRTADVNKLNCLPLKRVLAIIPTSQFLPENWTIEELIIKKGCFGSEAEAESELARLAELSSLSGLSKEKVIGFTLYIQSMWLKDFVSDSDYSTYSRSADPERTEEKKKYLIQIEQIEQVGMKESLMRILKYFFEDNSINKAAFNEWEDANKGADDFFIQRFSSMRISM